MFDWLDRRLTRRAMLRDHPGTACIINSAPGMGMGHCFRHDFSWMFAPCNEAPKRCPLEGRVKRDG